MHFLLGLSITMVLFPKYNYLNLFFCCNLTGLEFERNYPSDRYRKSEQGHLQGNNKRLIWISGVDKWSFIISLQETFTN